MTRPAFVLALAPLLAVATPAPADDAAVLSRCLADAEARGTQPVDCVGRVENPCIDALATPGYAEAANCVSREAAAWDALLNTGWRQLMSELGDSEQVLVRDAQRKWIAFRDADCEAATRLAHPARGGLWGADCTRTRTAERVIAIRAMIGDRGQ